MGNKGSKNKLSDKELEDLESTILSINDKE